MRPNEKGTTKTFNLCKFFAIILGNLRTFLHFIITQLGSFCVKAFVSQIFDYIKMGANNEDTL